MFVRACPVSLLVLLGLVLATGAARAGENSLLNDFTLRRWAVEDGLPEATVTMVRQATDGYLWCALPRHVVRFDGVRFVVATPVGEIKRALTEVREPEPLADLPPGLVRAEIAHVASGPGEVTWVLGAGQLHCRQTGTWTRVALPAMGGEEAAGVAALAVDRTGALWVGAEHGVYRWFAGSWSVLTARDGVFPWDVQCLTVDREGNIWVGTTGGLLRLRQKLLDVFQTGLPTGDEAITALWVEAPATFWVGVAGSGLLTGPVGAWRPVQLGELPENATVATLCRTREGTLWVGTQGDGLWRSDRAGTSRVPGARGVSALLEDRQGKLWVGTWDGLMQVDPAGKLVAVGTPDALPVEAVTALCEDHLGQVWAGYQSSGLICFSADGAVKRDGLPGGSICTIYEDAAKQLWVGTTTGLGWLMPDNQWQRFTSANGLVDDVILQILDDDLGHLWLGTRFGIMRVKKTEFGEVAAGRKQVLPARAFGVDAGMADEECTGRLGARPAKTADGRLWFPTMEGVVMADPRAIPHYPEPPPVQIEEVRAAGVLYPVGNATTLQLPRGARDVEIRVTMPVLTRPERAHFKYRLEGFETEWSRAVPDRTVRYPQLPAGRYELSVIGRDRDSAWGAPSTMTLEVLPFVWETLLFRVGLGLAAILFVISGVRLYDQRKTARQVAELERRNALERERTRIARDIHDDVGAGLTEMALLSELAQDEPGATREHLDRIFRRSRELTQSLNEIVWAINPRNDTLEGFLSYIAEFAQGFLKAAGVACRLDFPRDPPVLPMNASLRHHLSLAIKEVLNNIIKHAEATEVHVRVEFIRQELKVTLEDNGVGFRQPAAPGHEGDGLANLETRLQEIGGRVERSSDVGQGTRVRLTVRLPVGKA